MITITPEQIGEVFCIASLANEMDLVTPLLSADLKAAIDAALGRNAQFEAANPGDKPPLGDGLPWRSFPDYADGCTVGEVSIDPDEARVLVHYAFSEYPDGDYANELVLRPATIHGAAATVWRIHDVDLGDGSSLRSAMAGAFDP